MKIEDIELDPNPPQKGEPVTVSVKAKLCKPTFKRSCSVVFVYMTAALKIMLD